MLELLICEVVEILPGFALVVHELWWEVPPSLIGLTELLQNLSDDLRSRHHRPVSLRAILNHLLECQKLLSLQYIGKLPVRPVELALECRRGLRLRRTLYGIQSERSVTAYLGFIFHRLVCVSF